MSCLAWRISAGKHLSYVNHRRRDTLIHLRRSRLALLTRSFKKPEGTAVEDRRTNAQRPASASGRFGEADGAPSPHTPAMHRRCRAPTWRHSSRTGPSRPPSPPGAHPLLEAAAGGGGRAVSQLRRLPRPQQAPREAPRPLAGHGHREAGGQAPLAPAARQEAELGFFSPPPPEPAPPRATRSAAAPRPEPWGAAAARPARWGAEARGRSRRLPHGAPRWPGRAVGPRGRSVGSARRPATAEGGSARCHPLRSSRSGAQLLRWGGIASCQPPGLSAGRRCLGSSDGCQGAGHRPVLPLAWHPAPFTDTRLRVGMLATERL